MSEKKQQSVTMPEISNQNESFGVYTFTMSNCNVSIANAIRRTLITDIPCVCFNVNGLNEKKDELNSIKIFENTTSFNNEILRQRLACIPVHIKEFEKTPIDNLYIEIDEENKTDSMQYITTKDFKIYDANTNRELSKAKRDEIFPADSITGDHILFARLKPSISKTIPGQKLKLKCKLQVSTAKHNGQFNVCCTSAYSNTIDPSKQQDAWSKEEERLRTLFQNSSGVVNGETKGILSQKEQENMLEEAKDDWFLHDSKRYFKKNSFDFKIETSSVYTNEELIKNACMVLMVRLTKFMEDVEKFRYIPDTTNVEHSFDIEMPEYSYTIGKVIEFLLNELYFKKQNIFSYVGFVKKHPHDNFSVIRIIFNDGERSNQENIKILLKSAATTATEIFDGINRSFV